MITRRRFHALAGSAAAAISVPSAVRGRSLPVIRLGNAAGIIDTQVIFLTMGQHPRLKFYEEGCRMELLTLSGVGQAIQALDIVFPYCWLRQPHWSVAVKPNSPITSLAELMGHTIGIRNQGDTGYFGAR